MKRPAAAPAPSPASVARVPITLAMAGAQRQLSAGLSYEMGIDSFFGASHAIRPDGPRHTHSFRVQVTLVSDALDEEGMMRGFRGVSNVLNEEIQQLANRFLNEIEPFDVIQATSENLAGFLFRKLREGLAGSNGSDSGVVALTLWENPTTYVRVRAAHAWQPQAEDP